MNDKMNGNHSTTVETIPAGDLFSRTYSVPLYQREYAWGREEIKLLLDDFKDSFESDKSRHYHVGSLTAFVRVDAAGRRSYELIDGQQRTITLALLLRILSGVTPAGSPSFRLSERLRFENRPDAESFLAAFDERPHDPPAMPMAFRRAVDTMLDHPVFGEEFRESLPEFAKFVGSHVVLFLVTMPSETDVSAYFEIMNNRGLQLEYHELLKAKLIAKLPDDVDKRMFDKLWTACSRMDGRLEDNLDTETIQWITDKKQWWKLDNKNVTVNETPREEAAPRSIIPDFPNFLLHVLRFYMETIGYQDSADDVPLDAGSDSMYFALGYQDSADDVPLDERQMRKAFDDRLDAIEPEHFLDVLLRTRLRFDRFVIKAEDDSGRGEIRGCIEGRDDWSQGDRERLTHLQAMLQVSYPSRRHKEWLSRLLCADYLEDAQGLIDLLEGFARERLRERGPVDSLRRMGAATPHIALNLIDYLMYCANPETYSGSSSFRFAYHNSIEHHFPQGSGSENGPWTNEAVNDIGNLYLLSKSDNSALNVRGPDQKAALVGKLDVLPPKRRAMYRMTLADGWTPDVMRRHSDTVLKLLEAFSVEQQKGTGK